MTWQRVALVGMTGTTSLGFGGLTVLALDLGHDHVAFVFVVLSLFWCIGAVAVTGQTKEVKDGPA